MTSQSVKQERFGVLTQTPQH